MRTDRPLAAVWVAKLDEAVEVLEDLVVLLDPLAEGDAVESGEERATDEALDDLDDMEDPLEVALSVVTTAREEADAALEARLAAWLAEDPEHWPIFRLALFDAWRDERGGLDPTVPGWVRVLTTNAALAHFQRTRMAGSERAMSPDRLSLSPLSRTQRAPR